MSKPNEVFHGGQPVDAGEVRSHPSGMRKEAKVFNVGTAPATTVYRGELRIPVHPLAGSVCAMGISYKLEPGERSRQFLLPVSECGLSVVQGRGKIRICDVNHDIEVGDLAFVPVQGRFTIENNGDEPLVLLGLITPPDSDILRVAGLWMD